MANPHNGHGTLADEPWQAIFSNNNTGLPSDITDERDSLDELIDKLIESHCRRSGHTEKTPWSVEEVLKLIVGVLSTTPPDKQKRWTEIGEVYFKKERTTEQLKQKWKDLTKHAAKKTDGEQWLFYMMAAIVEVAIQSDKTEVVQNKKKKSDKTEVLNNVVKEWYVTSERTALALKVCDWLESAKNMKLEQQLNKIKEYVTAAEQNHEYDKIPYWSSQVHP